MNDRRGATRRQQNDDAPTHTGTPGDCLSATVLSFCLAHPDGRKGNGGPGTFPAHIGCVVLGVRQRYWPNPTMSTENNAPYERQPHIRRIDDHAIDHYNQGQHPESAGAICEPGTLFGPRAGIPTSTPGRFRLARDIAIEGTIATARLAALAAQSTSAYKDAASRTKHAAERACSTTRTSDGGESNGQ